MLFDRNRACGLFGAALLAPAACAPAPQANGIDALRASNLAIATVPDATFGPPQATGSPSGSLDLLGDDGAHPDDVIPAGRGAIVDDGTLVPGQTAEGDDGLFLDFSDASNPQPIRGAEGGTDAGPRNYAYDRINSDLLARPGSDSGNVPNSHWPMGLSSNRLGEKNAGWARQQNVDEMPVATQMAGVDMSLQPFAYREMHWHSAGEWAYIFNGSVRIAAMDQNGQSFIDDLVAGDVWFFPPGIPHSIQALEQGAEFLLIFDNGDFSEDGTDLVSELFIRNPKQVLAKNMQTDISALDNIPNGQLYIFPGTNPGSLDDQRIIGPSGAVPSSESFSYHFSKQEPYVVPGGSVKIVDPSTFPIANQFSAALVTIQPGAMRELHWHLTSDEWNFFIAGTARLTVFVAPSASRTFDFMEGDVGYIPASQSHYIENTGDTDVVFLEALLAPRFTDISVNQWLALTPTQVVTETLNIDKSVIENLPKFKSYIVPGSTNHTETNFTASTNEF